MLSSLTKPVLFFFSLSPWNVRCWMRRVEGCRHPDPWYWPLLQLPAVAWPRHSNPCCTPHVTQSSLQRGTTCVWEVSTDMGGWINQPPCAKSLTCKVFYIHISSLADELLDSPYLSTDRCSVQPCLSSLISFVYFVFGFRCRVWRSLLTQARLQLVLWCCVWRDGKNIHIKTHFQHPPFIFSNNTFLYISARGGRPQSKHWLQYGGRAHSITFKRLN